MNGDVAGMLTAESRRTALAFGDETFCASFGTFTRRRNGAMCATQNPPPATCRYVG